MNFIKSTIESRRLEGYHVDNVDFTAMRLSPIVRWGLDINTLQMLMEKWFLRVADIYAKPKNIPE